MIEIQANIIGEEAMRALIDVLHAEGYGCLFFYARQLVGWWDSSPLPLNRFGTHPTTDGGF